MHFTDISSYFNREDTVGCWQPKGLGCPSMVRKAQTVGVYYTVLKKWRVTITFHFLEDLRQQCRRLKNEVRKFNDEATGEQ